MAGIYKKLQSMNKEVVKNIVMDAQSQLHDARREVKSLEYNLSNIIAGEQNDKSLLKQDGWVEFDVFMPNYPIVTSINIWDRCLPPDPQAQILLWLR